MNMFNVDVTSKALVAECWIPDADVGSVRTALKHASVISKFIFLIFILLIVFYFYIYFAGNVRKFFYAHINGDVNEPNAANFLPDQQVHVRIPNSCECLRNGKLSRSEPWIIHHHYVPVPLCCHVWRCWTRTNRHSFCRLSLFERGNLEKSQRRGIKLINTVYSPSILSLKKKIIYPLIWICVKGVWNHLRWSLHHLANGAIQHLHWNDI